MSEKKKKRKKRKPGIEGKYLNIIKAIYNKPIGKSYLMGNN
jgi:hypothetical protein